MCHCCLLGSPGREFYEPSPLTLVPPLACGGAQLGQALSTRPDILPQAYCQELSRACRTACPPSRPRQPWLPSRRSWGAPPRWSSRRSPLNGGRRVPGAGLQRHVYWAHRRPISVLCIRFCSTVFFVPHRACLTVCMSPCLPEASPGQRSAPRLHSHVHPVPWTHSGPSSVPVPFPLPPCPPCCRPAALGGGGGDQDPAAGGGGQPGAGPTDPEGHCKGAAALPQGGHRPRGHCGRAGEPLGPAYSLNPRRLVQTPSKPLPVLGTPRFRPLPCFCWLMDPRSGAQIPARPSLTQSTEPSLTQSMEPFACLGGPRVMCMRQR